jgi:photosystem II stability/assembly factor-like uncharacterized protein
MFNPWRAASRRTLGVLLLGLFLLAGLPALPGRAAPAPLVVPDWQDTGITLPDLHLPLCFDATRPNMVLVADDNAGTVAFDWTTGARTVVNSRPFTLCGPNGLLFAGDRPAGPGWRFSLDDPTGQAIAHLPGRAAQDGSNRVYALELVSPTGPAARLWASADGGLTWEQKNGPPTGSLESIAVAPADGRLLYGVAVEVAPGGVTYVIYASPDGGTTWEQRARRAGPSNPAGPIPYWSVEAIPGRAAPAGTIVLVSNTGTGGSSSVSQVAISDDGGRTFVEAGSRGLNATVQLVYTNNGILRLASDPYNYTLARSTDGGRTWLVLASPIPPPAAYAGEPVMLDIAQAAPANVFLRGRGSLWYSADSGATWQAFADRGKQSQAVTAYLPLTVLGVENNRLATLALPAAGHTLTDPVPATGAATGRYFPPTGHNLSPLFRPYWDAHGGLAQFGYPTTEPFREAGTTDGRVYLVQYFQRNRFEYHPEHAGSPYEVLLGLLGNQITESRRAAGEAPFVRVPDPATPGVAYFAPTGHTLRGAFRQYWEQHGGLAVYGYPISEETAEASPTDGRVYTVQYFERAVLEQHPENRPPYDILLSLLGVFEFDARYNGPMIQALPAGP